MKVLLPLPDGVCRHISEGEVDKVVDELDLIRAVTFVQKGNEAGTSRRP